MLYMHVRVGAHWSRTKHLVRGFAAAGRKDPFACCTYCHWSSFQSWFYLIISLSLLSYFVVQRALTNGPDSATGGRGNGGSSGRKDADRGGQEGVGGSAGAAADAKKPVGRGRGAFSQYLRTHEVRHLPNQPPAP